MNFATRAFLLQMSLLITLPSTALAVETEYDGGNQHAPATRALPLRKSSQQNDEQTLDRLSKELSPTSNQRSQVQLNEVQDILKRDANNVRAHLIAGELLANLGLQNFARSEFKAADKLSPGSFIEEYHRLLRQSPFCAVRIAFFGREDYPNDGAVLYDIARLNMVNNFRRSAIEILERASMLREPWPDTNGTLAKLYLDAGQPGKSMRAAETELKADPLNVRAQRVLLLAKWRLGTSLAELAPELKKLLQQHPDDPDLNLMQAQLSYDRHQFEDAVKPDLFALMQEDGGYTINIAKELFAKLSQKVPQQDLLCHVDAVAPDSSQNLRRSLLRLRVAEVWAQAGKHNAASQQLARALKMHPYFVPMAYYRLGNEMCKMHNLDAAAFCYKRALQGKPGDPYYQRAAQRSEQVSRNRKNDIAYQLKTVIRGH